MHDFDGRTAVITGGASGIGLAVAHRLAAVGMNLVLADIEEPVLESVIGDFESRGVPAIGVRTDVADRESVESLAVEAGERFGSVHVLVNNAGVAAGGPLLDDDDHFYEKFEWTMGVNLLGVLHGIRSFVPSMLAHGEPGHVVNTASMAGLIPAPFGPYTVSKYATVALSELLAQETAGTNVGVSVLCPFFVKTEIGDSDRNLPEHLVQRGEPSPEQEARSEVIRDLVAGGIDPALVAQHVQSAIVDGRFWILTHPGSENHPRERAEQIAGGTAPALWEV